jgi:hypothetical protein
MALVCNSTVALPETDFEFIDCSTLSINYSVRGLATISFSVVSTRRTLVNDYSNLNFGDVNFKGFVTNVDINPIPGTLVFEIKFSILAFGC